MHALFFSLKRAFHGTLRLSRQILPSLGLTAARFDMMYAIEEHAASLHEGPDHPRRLRQSDLRRILGVTAPTVTVMLRSLEKLGFVARTRAAYDRRQVLIELTKLGRRIIRRAMALVIGGGAVQLAVDCALAGKHVFDESACIMASSEAEGILSRLRSAYRDYATLDYPWIDDE